MVSASAIDFAARQHLIIIGSDLQALIEASVLLGYAFPATTLAHTTRPLQRAACEAARQEQVVIVLLDGSETAAAVLADLPANGAVVIGVPNGYAGTAELQSNGREVVDLADAGELLAATLAVLATGLLESRLM